MARWSEAQAWIRPHSQPSLNIYDVVTDGSNHLSRDRFDIPDSGRAPSAGEERGLVRSFRRRRLDRKSTRLNSSHVRISYAVFCLKKKKRELIRDNVQVHE